MASGCSQPRYGINRGRTPTPYGRPGAGYLGSQTFMLGAALGVLRSQISSRSGVTAWHNFSSMAFSQTRRKGRHAWRYCSPSSLHLSRPPLPFVRTSCRNCRVCAEKYMQAALEEHHQQEPPGSCFRLLKMGVVESFDEVTPPASIADFPPPVIPEFGKFIPW